MVSTLVAPSRLAPAPILTLTDTPTLEQLKIWWAEMQNDPSRPLAYTDKMSSDLDDFLAPVRQGDIRISMFLCDKKVGGVFYFHDNGTDADGLYAWLGAYILPAYRGSIAAQAWTLTRRACAANRLHRIFAAIRYSNRPAKRFITGKMGFTRLGSYVDWAPFQKRYDTVTLFSMRRQDQGLAWVLAEKRARQFRERGVLLNAASAGDEGVTLEKNLGQLTPQPEPRTITRHPRVAVSSPALLLTLPLPQG